MFVVCVCVDVAVCSDQQWTCFNRQCLTSRKQLCDGVSDCSDGSDESYTHARCPGVFLIIITSLPKVIWEEGRVVALSHTYAVKSPLVTMARPKFVNKSTPSRRPIPKPTICLIPRPVRLIPNGIQICTGQTDAPTDQQIVHGESLITLGRCASNDSDAAL